MWQDWWSMVLWEVALVLLATRRFWPMIVGMDMTDVGWRQGDQRRGRLRTAGAGP